MAAAYVYDYEAFSSQAKFGLSRDAPEFVPGAVSLQTGEHEQWQMDSASRDTWENKLDPVPMMKQPFAPFAGACYAAFQPALNLDQYSDASDSEDELEPPSRACEPQAAELTPAAEQSPCEQEEPVTPKWPSPASPTSEPAAEPSPGGQKEAPLGDPDAPLCEKPLASPWRRVESWPAGSWPPCAGPGVEGWPIFNGGFFAKVPWRRQATAGCGDEDRAEATASEPEAEEISCDEAGNEDEVEVAPMSGLTLLNWRAAAHGAPDVALARALRLEDDAACKERAPVARHTPHRHSLEASRGSWASQQLDFRRRSSFGQLAPGDEVPRAIRSILNKLTVEKFQPLSQKLLACGIENAGHIEVLIKEVFEKATTQHHFIGMYTDLCVLVQEHFAANPVSDDPKCGFKRLLLNECQASFERNLSPPAELTSLQGEEKTVAEFRYKNRMLGNIKFIGALLARRMLASKVCLAIVQELVTDPTPEALESLAALLTAVGPALDTPGWSYQPLLAAMFEQVRQIIARPSCDSRSRCLLRDVLDLRASGWESRRASQAQTPTTLEEVSRSFSCQL